MGIIQENRRYLQGELFRKQKLHMQRAWGRKDLTAIDRRLVALESSEWKGQMVLLEAWRHRQKPNHTSITGLVTFWTLPWAYGETFSSFLSKCFRGSAEHQPALAAENLSSSSYVSCITYYKQLYKHWVLGFEEKVSFWYLISSSPTTFPCSADGAMAIHLHQIHFVFFCLLFST